MTLNVFLDANVLVPVVLTDVMLRLAEAGLIDPHWSGQVLDEVDEALARVHPEMASAARQRRLEAMNTAFEYALTTVDEETIALFQLPDPDDRHVAAGAKLSQATIIVTNNTKDFPASVLESHGIEVKTPDQLLLMLLADEPEAMITVIHDAAAATKNPPLSVNHILESLSRAQAPGFASAAMARLNSTSCGVERYGANGTGKHGLLS